MSDELTEAIWTVDMILKEYGLGGERYVSFGPHQAKSVRLVLTALAGQAKAIKAKDEVIEKLAQEWPPATGNGLGVSLIGDEWFSANQFGLLQGFPTKRDAVFFTAGIKKEVNDG